MKKMIVVPDKVVAALLTSVAIKHDQIVNRSVRLFYTPQAKHLREEAEKIFSLIENEHSFTQEELKEVLFRCLAGMEKTPVLKVDSISYILQFLHKNNEIIFPYNKNYNYINIVDDSSDAFLMEYGEKLSALIPSYFMYCREPYVSLDTVISNWDKVCEYPDTYRYIAEIFRLYPIKTPLTMGIVLTAIIGLDDDVKNFSVRETKRMDIFPTVLQKCESLRCVVNLYYTDNAYLKLGVDSEENTEKLLDYYKDVNRISYERYKLDGDEEWYKYLKQLEMKGRILFRKFSQEKASVIEAELGGKNKNGLFTRLLQRVYP